jgi:hypothetical protein
VRWICLAYKDYIKQFKFVKLNRRTTVVPKRTAVVPKRTTVVPKRTTVVPKRTTVVPKGATDFLSLIFV